MPSGHEDMPNRNSRIDPEQMAPAVRRYNDLSEETRKFLERLRPEDVVFIEKSIKNARDIEAIGKFTKWLILAMIAIFVGAVSLGENIMKVWQWLHPSALR